MRISPAGKFYIARVVGYHLQPVILFWSVHRTAIAMREEPESLLMEVPHGVYATRFSASGKYAVDVLRGYIAHRLISLGISFLSIMQPLLECS
ncbi:MAG TPA: hypothetical protein VJ761_00960 [Ktedonobacteraceae bacterium]|nr:hypothetical protein [Ktedonobacteraceae bacterium]